jgi:myo-inositol-1(or 4)-monophosphatase
MYSITDIIEDDDAYEYQLSMTPELAVAPFDLVRDHLQQAVMELHPCFAKAIAAAHESAWIAVSTKTRDELGKETGIGADGTPTSYLDEVVEIAILEALEPLRINVLSEEAGFIDRGSAFTLVIDPVDGTANAIAGVPVAGFGAALAEDGIFIQAAMTSLTTGACWAGKVGGTVPFRTSLRTELAESAVSLLRPRSSNEQRWWAVAQQADRVRILSTSIVEAGLVAQGSTDAFLDAGSDTHRLVDLAPASVLLPLAGGVVVDLFGRPITFSTDLTLRWSGIVAATAELAGDIIDTIESADEADNLNE